MGRKTADRGLFTGTRTAIYCRLSKDDELQGESASIQHQRDMIANYCEEQGWQIVGIYADDGFTGLNQNRPDFQRMIKDCDAGLIDIVITKDLSRLGRNYLETGWLQEQYFPKKGIRYIALNDGYDTTRTEGNELTPFKNMMNEFYAKDISDKQKLSLQARSNNGQHIASTLVFGYKTDPNDKRHWIIDEDAAITVRMVFKLYNSGMSVPEIARTLRNRKRYSPSAHIGRVKAGSKTEQNPYYWCGSSVTAILRRQEYCGDTVNFKTKRISYKTKEKIKLPKSEWKIFKNTHTAIISRELYDAAQEKLNNLAPGYLPRKYNYDTLFHHKCFCSECGRKMSIDYRAESQSVYFQCTYKRMDSNNCKSHNTRDSTLRKILSIQISTLHKSLLSDENMILNKIGLLNMPEMQEELDYKNIRIEEIQTLVKTLFESKCNGEISNDDFILLSARYSEEQNELQKSVNTLSLMMNQKRQKMKKVKDILNYIKIL